MPTDEKHIKPVGGIQDSLLTPHLTLGNLDQVILQINVVLSAFGVT